MKAQEVASRYAQALFELTGVDKSTDESEATFDQLRALSEAVTSNEMIKDFLASPLVRPDAKAQALDEAFSHLRIEGLVKSFVLLLAQKRRLDVIPEIVLAYQALADQKHGVVRGVVRSPTVLAPEERKRVEETVQRVTGKQSLLTYKEDPSLLGGLVAEVGGFTFDDSLSSHLRRLNEQLTRRSV